MHSYKVIEIQKTTLNRVPITGDDWYYYAILQNVKTAQLSRLLIRTNTECAENKEFMEEGRILEIPKVLPVYNPPLKKPIVLEKATPKVINTTKGSSYDNIASSEFDCDDYESQVIRALMNGEGESFGF